MSATAKAPRLLLIVMASSFFMNLAFAINRSVFTNFASGELGLSAAQFGWLEGIREIPGLLTIVLIAMVARLADERIYVLSGALIGTGIALYFSANSFADLVVATLVNSIGFHMWVVVQDSLVINSIEVSDRARRLGQVNSVAAAAGLLGMGVVFLLNRLPAMAGLRPFFLVAGLVGVVGALMALLMKPADDRIKRPSFVFNWRYRSYYILTLLSGARRHIVMTFATFALVRIHGASVTTMTILFAVTSFIAIWSRPMIGKLIDRVGEQRALSLNYAVVALVFLGYAFVPVKEVVFALFVLDNVLTGFDIAISTHAGRLIPKAELSSSLATGTTINHIFGVAVPVFGGMLWEWVDPVLTFTMGTVLVVVAMIYSWNLDARSAKASTPAAG